MFVGRQREGAVSRLVQDWDRVRRGAGPSVVFLSAPLGWGKTRIIQEFYTRLAANEGNGYWPPRIVVTSDHTDVSRLTLERKRLQPGPFPVAGDPPYIWLSVHSDPSEFGRPEEAYRTLVEQLQPHLGRILRKRRLTSAAATAIRRSLLAFVPIPADIDTYLDVGDAVKDLIVEFRGGRNSARIVGADRTAEQAAQFWKLLSTIWGKDGQEGPPIVLAIEDAHYVSTVSVELLRTLLASKLPLLVIASGWPVRKDSDSRTAPFAEFVHSHPSRLRIEALDRLTSSDLQSVIRTWHPGTDESVVRILAERTGGNPYALRLALIRLKASRGQALVVNDDRLRRMPFDIHTQFEHLLWSMPDGARLSLAAAAILGYRLPRVVATHGLKAIPDGSLLEAMATDWLRADELSVELISFVEPLRHEVARSHGLENFSTEERLQILRSGLHALRRLLADRVPDPDRPLLYELHVAFAEAGVEENHEEVLRSAVSLLQALRVRRARAATRDLVRRVDSLLASSKASTEVRAEYAVERARSTRFTELRAHADTATAVESALRAVEALNPPRPDLTIRAYAEKCRLHRNIDTPEMYDLALSRTMLDRALAAMAEYDVHDDEIVHNIRCCEYGVIASEGDRGRATQLAITEARRTQMSDGSQTLFSLDSLSDAAWYATRSDDLQLALDLTYQLLALQTAFWGSDANPVVATSSKDLAIRLVRMNIDHLVPEAHERVCTAYSHLEAAYGPEELPSITALSARGYIAMRYGLIVFDSGDVSVAQEHFQSGLADCELAWQVRRRKWPAKQHLLIQEHVALGRALTGQPNALDDLRAHLHERRVVRQQGPSKAEVQWLARDLVLALRHAGKQDEAKALAMEYLLRT